MTLILYIYLFGMVWYFIVIAFPVYRDIEDEVNESRFGYLIFLALVLLWPIILVGGICNYLTKREQ